MVINKKKILEFSPQIASGKLDVDTIQLESTCRVQTWPGDISENLGFF